MRNLKKQHNLSTFFVQSIDIDPKFVLQCDSERGGVPLNYKEAVMKLVGKIHSEKVLKRIYKFVLYLYTMSETGS